DSRPHPHPHSFPTRRSSDLGGTSAEGCHGAGSLQRRLRSSLAALAPVLAGAYGADLCQAPVALVAFLRQETADHEQEEAMNKVRSEEHTSELQSQSNLVCRL